mgnify:CR=1 FL=1
MVALGQLADTATVEYVRCLLGAMRRVGSYEFYTIDAAVPPVSLRRVKKRQIVSFDCSFAALIGVWHNHVLAEFQDLEPGPWSWDAPTPAAEACQLSRDDLLTTLRGASGAVAVVQVDARTFCWWYRDALQRRFAGVAPDSISMRPDSGQLIVDWRTP